MKRAKPTFTLFERPLAQALGLAVKILREKRGAHLKAGEDWQMMQHCVAYSDAGFELLLLQLQLAQKKAGAGFALATELDVESVKNAARVCPCKPPLSKLEKERVPFELGDEVPPPVNPPQKNAPAPSQAPQAGRWVKVVRLAKNPRLLMCHEAGAAGGPPVTVYVEVRDRAKFPTGMKIPVQVKAKGSSLLVLACREPRLRGRLPDVKKPLNTQKTQKGETTV